MAAALVLDTGVLVAAFRSSAGASRQLVNAALERRFQLVLSVPLCLEYEAVLTRSEQLSAFGLTQAEVLEVLEALASVALRVTSKFRVRPALPDPGDELVLEAAVNGHADAIVTFNVRHFERGAREYGRRVLSPMEALRSLRR